MHDRPCGAGTIVRGAPEGSASGGPALLECTGGFDTDTAPSNADAGGAEALSLQPASWCEGVMAAERCEQHTRTRRIIVVHHDTVTAMHHEMHAIEQTNTGAARGGHAGMPFGRGIHERQERSRIGKSHGALCEQRRDRVSSESCRWYRNYALVLRAIDYALAPTRWQLRVGTNVLAPTRRYAGNHALNCAGGERGRRCARPGERRANVRASLAK